LAAGKPNQKFWDDIRRKLEEDDLSLGECKNCHSFHFPRPSSWSGETCETCGRSTVEWFKAGVERLINIYSRRVFPDNSKQKILHHVKGEVLLERLVRQLREAGFEHIRLVTGYGVEGIEEFNCNRKLGLELVYNPQWRGDPVESLRCGAKDLDDDALIIFGDILANTQIFRKFWECKAPLAWIKTKIPWGKLPDDEVLRTDRQVCIVKIANETLSIFEKEKAEEYLTQFAKRLHFLRMTKVDVMRLNGLLLEGMYWNGPVEEIIVSSLHDVDRYNQTDEGKEKTPRYQH